MIQATELRIGNLVNCRIGKELAKDYQLTGVVKSISYHNALATNYTLPATSSSIFEVDIEKNIDQFDPIPLTEEWLVKCGFVKDGHYNSANRFVSKSPVILIEGNGYYTLPNYPTNEIYHVHQLQNLYFALTGEELNIEQHG